MKLIALGCIVAAAVCYDSVSADLQFESAVALGNINSPEVNEASGIAASRLTAGVFWTHNDGSRNTIYAFKMNGELLASYNLGKNPDDVEDIAVGPGPKAATQYLYVGDIGSNSATRQTLRIYRIEEPAVNLDWAADPISANFQGVDTCRVSYPDGTFDAEAIMIDPIDRILFVVTKERGTARLYSTPLANLADGVIVALDFAGFVAMSQVSGADISADGSMIVLRREEYAVGWLRSPGVSVAETLQGPSLSFPVVGTPTEPNGEAISFLPDNSGYITLSEGESQPVYFFKRACDDSPEFIGLPVREESGLRLNFQGCPGAQIAIERSSTGFAAPDWKEIGSVTLGSNPGTFVDQENVGTRFYRLRVVGVN